MVGREQTAVKLPFIIKGSLSETDAEQILFNQAKKATNIICFSEKGIVERSPFLCVKDDDIGDLHGDMQEADLIVIYDARIPLTKEQKLSFFDKMPPKSVTK